jgi:hypothetical protein
MIPVKFLLEIDDNPAEFLNEIVNMEWIDYLKAHCYRRDDMRITEQNMIDKKFKVIEYQFHLTENYEILYRIKFGRRDD